MKKSLLLAAMLTLCSATCFATIPTSELAIGGIVPGNSPSYVQSVFGAPTKFKHGTDYYGRTVEREIFFTYGKSFKIRFYDDFAISIVSKANNGLSTPSGIHVGSSVTEVKRTFGTPDKLPPYLRNKKDILRYIDEPYSRELLLKIKNGKVIEMTLSPAEAY